MESYQTELQTIRDILKNNPKGMTVTDIARHIKINRNSVAKYLDILLISGHVEMITFGPAKVYFPSKRIPLSTILNITADYSLLLDKNLHLLQINDKLLTLFNIPKQDIVGHHIEKYAQILIQIPDLLKHAQQALEGHETTTETQYQEKNHTRHLHCRYIPTTLDNGEPAITIIITDTTHQKTTEHLHQQHTKEWETAFNIIQEKISILDHTFTIKRVNQAYATFFHQTPETCIGKKCWEIIHHTKDKPSTCHCKIITSTKQPTSVEFYEPSIDKNLIISSTPMIDNNGELMGLIQLIKEKTP